MGRAGRLARPQYWREGCLVCEKLLQAATWRADQRPEPGQEDVRQRPGQVELQMKSKEATEARASLGHFPGTGPCEPTLVTSQLQTAQLMRAERRPQHLTYMALASP